MCGICGVYCRDSDQAVDPGALERMKTLISHRGPDQDGSHVEPQVGLGHRRLSIIGVGNGKQPLSNETGDVWVVFNGEIYNYRGLREGLRSRGHKFRSDSDTEVLVHLYEEDGPDFVRKLRGMFSIALWDRSRRRLVLARDRLGKKPLYWFDDGKRVIFASEIKSILSYPDVPRTPDLEAIHHYLSLAYVPAPLTAFEGVRTLPGGHLLVADAKGVEQRSYWDLEFEASERPFAELVDELDAKFQDAVDVRLESEVPLGVFLSGGVDSSAVAHRMSKSLSRQVTSTTIRFEDPAYDESEAAKSFADWIGTDHQVRDVGASSTDVIERILWHFDEPFADPSALPTYWLCKAARESLTVALSGDGGDEMFAGYNRYAQVAKEETLRRRLPAVLRRLVLPFAAVWPKHARGKTLLDNLNLSTAEAAGNTFFYFDGRDKRSLYSGEMRAYLAKQFETADLYRGLYAACESSDPISRVQYVDYKSYLVDDILVKVDRMSMAHSLEVRSPLLDHELVELVASFPSDVKLREGGGKYIFKKMLERHIPQEVLYRPKQGFSVPLTGWFRGELKTLIEDSIFGGSLVQRGYFDMDWLERLWKRQQTGGNRVIDLGIHFWALLMLELWHRNYIDSKNFLHASEETPALSEASCPELES